MGEVNASQQTKQAESANAQTGRQDRAEAQAQTGQPGRLDSAQDQTGRQDQAESAQPQTGRQDHAESVQAHTGPQDQAESANAPTGRQPHTGPHDPAHLANPQTLQADQAPAHTRSSHQDIAMFLEAYGRMYLIRLFENAMHRLFLAGEVHGTTHLSAGQEAVAVGVCMALRPDDYVAGTYRGHGHALAKGTPPAPLLAEMLGRVSGVCGGRAGSMNVVDLEHGLIGCYGIVGGSIAAALGAALSAKRQNRVAVAFFGDGAVNQAYFHECLNMAKVLSLPAIFVCENNFYGEFTPMASVTAGSDIAGRARAYDIPSAVIDGNDLWAVYVAANGAVEQARDAGGPTLLECRTYRHYGHSKSDPAPYRPKEEVEQWLARDPLKIARARLLEEDVTEEQIAAVEGKVSALIDKAVDEGVAAPYPDPAHAAASEFRP